MRPVPFPPSYYGGAIVMTPKSYQVAKQRSIDDGIPYSTAKACIFIENYLDYKLHASPFILAFLDSEETRFINAKIDEYYESKEQRLRQVLKKDLVGAFSKLRRFIEEGG